MIAAMPPVFELHAVAQYSTLRFLDSLAEGTLIGVFAAGLLRMARRQTAGTRFAIWFSALVAIAALPFIPTGISHAGAASAGRAAITLPDSWAIYFFAGWAMISSWFLLGIVRSIWHLHTVKKGCRVVDAPDVNLLIAETLRESGVTREVAVCMSSNVRVPTAIGLTRPAVVLPKWVAQELAPGELRQVLLHELAHLQRWDDWTNLAQQLVKAIFFFHPAVWWIERNMALEREIACDDAVLSKIESPRSYAECLAHLAERSFLQRSMALAQAAIGRIPQVSTRVAEILDVDRPKAGASAWKPAVSLVAGFAVVCAVGTASAPSIVAFQDVHPTAATAKPTAATSMMARQSAPESARSAAVAQHVPVIPAKLEIEPARGLSPMRHRKPAARYNVAKSAPANVHLASTKAARVPYTETLYLVIQDSSPDESYQIQMWRITVLRYVTAPETRRAPRKET